MAKDHGPSIKDDKLYEKLRDEGESQEKAARIANAKAGGTDVSKKGAKARATRIVRRRSSRSGRVR
jgi:hypothetical protein